MGYAIVLFYDEEADQAVRKVWDGIGVKLGKPSLSDLGARPHISLAVYTDDLDTTGFPGQLHEFAQSINPFDFCLSSVSVFTRQDGVVFLAPVVTRQLLAVQERFHEAFSQNKDSVVAHYQPGNWIPHCTVAIDLAPAEILEAVGYCREVFQPVKGRFQEIGLIEFRPVKELSTHKLG